jgi:hypothetical protein
MTTSEQKTSEQKTAENKHRKEYRKTHPNGRVPAFLDESDRVIIKVYCKHHSQPLKATVDLENNNCAIMSAIGNDSILIGTIQKVVYKDTFVLLNEFKLYPDRNRQPGTKTVVVTLKAGTELVVCGDDKNKLWVPINGIYELMPRWIFAKGADMKQMYSLFLTNAEDNVGAGEGQHKVDLVYLAQLYHQTTKHITQCISLA